MSKASDGIRRLVGGFDGGDLVVILGIILASVGAGLVYPPAGLIVAGVILLALGLFGMG